MSLDVKTGMLVIIVGAIMFGSGLVMFYSIELGQTDPVLRFIKNMGTFVGLCGMGEGVVFCYSPIDTENTCPVGTNPEFDIQGNLICRNIDDNQIVDLNTEIITDSQTGEMILDENQLYSIGIGTVALIIILGFYQFEKHKW